MDVSPKIINDRAFIPARYIIEPMDGEISWDNKEKKVTCILKNNSCEDITVNLWINKHLAEVDGTKVQIDPSNSEVTPVITNDRTLIPLRFLSENLELKVMWNTSSQTIQISNY
ncbi:MAG: copper amine oxidase N-terminal domain-containing protein [Caldisericia bacterium]|nr:copper amine oxidase N-terminal domain-containing protein [Caldisericia bacterium]